MDHIQTPSKRKYVPVLLLILMIFACTTGCAKQEQRSFRDLTVELGTNSLTVADFLTEHGNADRAAFVSDPGAIDLGKTGETTVTLKDGNREETVILSVQDTTAPTAAFQKRVIVPVNTLPEPEELVSEIQDQSEVRVYYAYEPVVPVDYRDITAVVVLEDANGNIAQQSCEISFSWLRESYALELGETLSKEDLLYDPQRDALLLEQESLDTINRSNIGTYTVTSRLGEQERTCTVTVQDTKGPELKLKELQRMKGRKASLSDFIISVTDESEIVDVRMISNLDTTQQGCYPVVIEAEDIYGNVTRGETKLWVAIEFIPPQLKGNFKPMTLAKTDKAPDFMEGVTAEDLRDGPVEVVCDTSQLDLTTGGTYYITYSATDSNGNTRTVKRKITVIHDEADVLKMVRAISDTLSDDPEEIRDYVRSKIYYSHDWGGDDPVWFGLNKKRGNCYVHAMCLKAIFDEKGIENRLIWVTNETHYWNLVKIGDTWRHIDSTPAGSHPLYSLMDDETRLLTLGGRKWDTSLWPACE